MSKLSAQRLHVTRAMFKLQSIQDLHLLFFHNVIGTSNFKYSGPAVQCSAVQCSACSERPAPSLFQYVIAMHWNQQLQHIQDLQCSGVEFRTCTFSFSVHQLDIVSQHLGPTAHLLSIAYMHNVLNKLLFINFTYLLFTKNNWYQRHFCHATVSTDHVPNLLISS